MASAPTTSTAALVTVDIDALADALADAVAGRIADCLSLQPDQRRTGLNSAEAAAYIGCSVETLRDEVACRKIASYQTAPGAPHYFDADDLDAYRLRHRLDALN